VVALKVLELGRDSIRPSPGVIAVERVTRNLITVFPKRQTQRVSSANLAASLLPLEAWLIAKLVARWEFRQTTKLGSMVFKLNRRLRCMASLLPRNASATVPQR
jgi:hypothetical protein